MFGLIGIDYTVANVDERACLALSEEEAVMLISDWKRWGYISGAVVLSTCNRVEIYYDSEENNSSLLSKVLRQSLQRNLELSTRVMAKLKELDGEELFRHLFRLSSGLESMVQGETQILGQLKEAFRIATRNKISTPLLSRLFHKAFEIAKKVRSNFMLGAKQLSAGASAVDFMLNKCTSSNIKPLIIGAGQIAETVYERLVGRGFKEVLLYNRTRERAERFQATHPKTKIFTEGDMLRAVQEANLIFVATSSLNPIILKEDLIKLNIKEDLFFFDLAVPRNIANDVVELTRVFSYAIDDLKNLTSEKEADEQQTLIEAEIETFVQDFVLWCEASGVRESIEDIQKVSQLLLKRELRNLPKTLSDQQRELIAQYDEHFRITYTTALVSALRELSEGERSSHYADTTKALFKKIKQKEAHRS